MAKLKSKYIYIILILNLGFSTILKAQNNDLVFHRLTVNDGLSSGNVSQIFQDSQGFIWIGTEDGLNLYDGYSFKTYKHSAADSNSISNNNIRTIIEDKNGKIWIGTNYGLNVFDRSSQTFKKYFFKQDHRNSISNDRISKFCFDRDDQLWIATDNGLNRYNPPTNDFTRYNVVEDLLGNVKGNTINAIACDKNGIIWTSEYFRGMFRIDPKTGSVKNFPISQSGGIFNEIVISICPNPNGNLWLGLMDGQIIDFDPYSEKAKYYPIISQNKSSEKDFVAGIVQSKNFLWFLKGTLLIKYDIQKHAFETYSNDPLNPESLPKGLPMSITQTKDGNIWIGLEGIVVFNPKGEKFSPYYHKLPKESSLIRQNYVRTFYIDKQDNLFIGTYLDGLIKLNQKTNNFKRMFSTGVFSGSSISDIKEQDDGNLWIATNKGLVLYDPILDKIVKHFVHNENDPNSLYHDALERIYPYDNKKIDRKSVV